MTAPTPRRRRNGRGTERSGPRGAWATMPIVVLLVAAGVVGWSTTRGTEPPPAPPGTTELPLSSADLMCPAVGAAKLKAARAGIGFTSLAPGGSNDRTDSAVELVPLPKGTSGSMRLRPGAWETDRQGGEASAPVVVSATGAMAAGASGYVATAATNQAGGGLAVADCVQPGREAWFVGAGSTVDHASTLLVTNPGDTEAIVDVSLLTADGDLEPVRTTGLVVGPREVVRLPLSDFAAGQGDAVVRVAASQGQVAAAVLDHWVATLDPAGTEWIPAAQPPSTAMTVSPMITDADRRELIVGNPSDRTATVDIQVVGPTGTAPVQGFESATVDPGGVEVVEVPNELNDQAAGLRLTSDLPVVASVRSVSDGNPVDLAYGTSVAEVTDPAVVPVDLPTLDPSGLSLAVTSADPSQEAALSVEAFDADGSSLAQRSVTADAGATAIWQADRRRDLDADISDVAYLVVTPTTGTLRGSVTFAPDDSSWSSLPLQSAQTVVLAPGVYPLQ